MSEYNPAMPWECVIRAAAHDESFWRKHVETPAMRAEYRQEIPSPAFWVGGLDDPEYSGIDARAKGKGRGNGGDYGGRGNDWGDGGGKGRGDGGGKDRGNGKGKGADRTGGPGAGKGKDAQRGDGRYYASVNGTQICFTFCRQKDGCKKVCPFGR